MKAEQRITELERRLANAESRLAELERERWMRQPVQPVPVVYPIPAQPLPWWTTCGDTYSITGTAGLAQ